MKNFESIRQFDYQKEFSLNSMRQILLLLENPEKSLKIIQIAGTKGKTSTAHYLADLLQISGSKLIGLYTSPHILSPTERIRINQIPISLEELDMLSNQVKALAQQNNISITYFEMMTAVALLYFKAKQADYVVLETGLGGRLDATNIASPVLSIITRIDKDHIHILGKSLLKIAYEKFGIIKNKVPSLLSPQRFFVSLYGSFIRWSRKSKKIPRVKTALVLENNEYKILTPTLEVNFSGPLYALENLKTALSALNFLKPNFKACFYYTHDVPGRFEIHSYRNSLFVLDGAHNPVSAKFLAKSLQYSWPSQKWIFVFNTQKDKDFRQMLPYLSKIAKSFILLQKEDFAAQEISDYFDQNKIQYEVRTIENLSFKQNEFYCVTGSFYLIGDIKKRFLEQS